MENKTGTGIMTFIEPEALVITNELLESSWEHFKKRLGEELNKPREPFVLRVSEQYYNLLSEALKNEYERK